MFIVFGMELFIGGIGFLIGLIIGGKICVLNYEFFVKCIISMYDILDFN